MPTGTRRGQKNFRHCPLALLAIMTTDYGIFDSKRLQGQLMLLKEVTKGPLLLSLLVSKKPKKFVPKLDSDKAVLDNARDTKVDALLAHWQERTDLHLKFGKSMLFISETLLVLGALLYVIDRKKEAGTLGFGYSLLQLVFLAVVVAFSYWVFYRLASFALPLLARTGWGRRIFFGLTSGTWVSGWIRSFMPLPFVGLIAWVIYSLVQSVSSNM